MKRYYVVLSIFLLFIIVVISCQKSDVSSVKPSLSTTLATSVAEITGIQISSVLNASEQGVSVEKFDGHSPAYVAGNIDEGNYGLPGYGISGIGHMKFGIPHIDSCATVTVSSSDYPKEITIVYSGDCTDHGKHIKQGKIVVDISDTLSVEGATETIRYEDFYIDSIKVELQATVKNMGKNSDGHWVISKEYRQVLTKNDQVCTRENIESAEWISGFETAGRSDNVYYLTGSGSVVLNDTTYTKTITTPLLFDASCNYILSGVVELKKNSSVATIDYGDGTCDNKATVTIDGTTEEIDLHSDNFREGGHFSGRCHGGFGH